ncbi:pentapeptide repeat-containing protein [Rhodococcus globerulus]|uniref:pentapeptide repeat-containing protein n=1 Tax=Rhodococcus globerulus TaxID=33008 RepID=UPI0035B543F4
MQFPRRHPLSSGARADDCDCDFTRAKAHKLRSVPNTVFDRCTFDDSDLAGAQFSDTSFVECTFGAVRVLRVEELRAVLVHPYHHRFRHGTGLANDERRHSCA